MAAQRFFSPGTFGFYSDRIHGSRIPEDAVPLTEPEYRQLLDAQRDGKTIVVRDGRPAAINPAEDVAAQAERNRNRRNRLLRESDWTQLPDSPFTKAERTAWAAWRQALRDLDLERSLSEADWPAPPGDA